MVSYHRPRDFSSSVDSILTNTDLPYHLTIIDNSCGKLDTQLSKYRDIQSVTIIRNESNIGKGQSFKVHYDQIETKHKYLISVDGDVIVPQNWLSAMVKIADTIENLAILSPELISIDGVPSMHHRTDEILVKDNLFYNKGVAGPLFLFNRYFYEGNGGYPGDCLYGHDDSPMCNKASRLKLFVGYTKKVKCIHSLQDDTPEYRQWRKENIADVTTGTGFWDQVHNPDNTAE